MNPAADHPENLPHKEADRVLRVTFELPFTGRLDHGDKLLASIQRTLEVSLHRQAKVIDHHILTKKPQKAPEAPQSASVGDPPSAPPNGAQNGQKRAIVANVLDQAIQKGGLPYDNSHTSAIRPALVVAAVDRLLCGDDSVIHPSLGSMMVTNPADGLRYELSQAEVAEVLRRFRRSIGGA